MKIEFSENIKIKLLFFGILILSFLVGEIYFYIINDYSLLSFELSLFDFIRIISSMVFGMIIITFLALIVAFFKYLKDNITIK